MREPPRHCCTTKTTIDSVLAIQANPDLTNFSTKGSDVVFPGHAAARWMGVVAALLLLSAACGKRNSSPPGQASAQSAPASAPVGEPGELGPGTEVTAEPVGRRYPLQKNPLAGCSICHVDVEDELSSGRHFEEKIGCQTCHGPSAGHLADENNEVAPDELFARADAERLCGDCHGCGRLDSGDETASREHPICTDCHDPHTLRFLPPPSP